jgi:hypothetical protein
MTRSECVALLKKIQHSKNPIEALDIPGFIYDRRINSGRFDLTRFPGYDPLSLYVGVANSRDDGSHHWYLIAGNKRFDAEPFFQGSTVSFFKENDRVLASNGVIFKLQVGEETLAKAMREMKDMRRLTCLHAVCDILRASGIELIQEGQKISAPVAAAGLLSGTIKNSAGELIPTELITNSNYQLHHLVSAARSAALKTPLENIPILLAFIIPTIPASGMSYVVVRNLTQ